MEKSSFFDSLKTTIGRILLECLERGIVLDLARLDHVCYRVHGAERFQGCKEFLETFAGFVQEAEFGGRPVATFRLHEPFDLDGQGRFLHVIELATYRPGTEAEEGFEHAEFLAEVPLDLFMRQHKHLDFDCKGLGKKLNPVIGLRLGEGRSVRFHRIPLDEVIRLEKALGLKPGI